MVDISATIFSNLSYDYLALLREKKKRGDLNKTIAAETEVLEWFYREIESLIKTYDLKVHELSLSLLKERMNSKMLEKELESLMKASLSMNPEDVKEVIENSSFDVDSMDIGVEIKHRMRKKLEDRMFDSVKKKFMSGTKLSEIVKHYILTEDQLIKLVDK